MFSLILIIITAAANPRIEVITVSKFKVETACAVAGHNLSIVIKESLKEKEIKGTTVTSKCLKE